MIRYWHCTIRRNDNFFSFRVAIENLPFYIYFSIEVPQLEDWKRRVGSLSS